MIIGSEPVSVDAIRTFNEAFAPYRVAADRHQALLRHRRGDAVRLDHRTHRRSAGDVPRPRTSWPTAWLCPVSPMRPTRWLRCRAASIARSQWAVIVDPDTGDELADGQVGEIWLQGDNIGRGYWGQTRRYPADLRRAAALAHWVRAATPSGRRDRAAPGCGRVIWAFTSTASSTSPADSPIWCSSAAAATIPRTSRPPSRMPHRWCGADTLRRSSPRRAGSAGEGLVIVAERAAGTSRSDPQPALDAIREAVLHRHGLVVSDVRWCPPAPYHGPPAASWPAGPAGSSF